LTDHDWTFLRRISAVCFPAIPLSLSACLLPGLSVCLLLGLSAMVNATAWTPPNIVVVLVDDAGFMDFGGFGGEARTPSINRIADQGVRFSNYHTSPLCAPSRAMLLTGLDNHLTGVATIPEVLLDSQADNPGYAMRLAPGVETVAARLKRAGYRTYMTGKWHLGSGPGDLPADHGFDRSFILDASGADNWEQKSYMPYYDEAPWFEDRTPATLPDDFYSSEFLVDQMIHYLSDATDPGTAESPFFAYIAFQAIHIPVQAPREFTDRYDGTYDSGWDVLRTERWQRAKAMGLIPENAPLGSKHESLRDWASLDGAEQALYSRSMAVNAGMLEAMDFHFGRLVDHLDAVGELDNTLFVITSDNGPEFNDPVNATGMGFWMWRNGYHHELSRLGEPGSMGFIGPEWASAAASPGRLFKFYATEGGLRVPLIIAGPGVGALGFVGARSFVTDIAPTLLDFAEVEDSERTGLTGRSLRDVLDSTQTEVYGKAEPVGMEVSGNSALFQDGFKLVRNTLPHGDGQWRLYYLAEDPAETRDLAEVLPDRFAALMRAYEAYEKRVGVVPVPAEFDALEAIRANALGRMLPGYLPWLIAVVVLLLVGAIFLYRRRRKFISRM
jgi:arylsulfatase/uncharacterized sulfatase